jgi:hypothetical protein
MTPETRELPEALWEQAEAERTFWEQHWQEFVAR